MATLTRRSDQNGIQTGGPSGAATIVKYDERQATLNAYPERIISPPHPSDCCAAGMAPVGDVEEDGSWLFNYKRCRTCGYTVRHFLMMSPTAMRAVRADLLRSLDVTRGRN